MGKWSEIGDKPQEIAEQPSTGKWSQFAGKDISEDGLVLENPHQEDAKSQAGFDFVAALQTLPAGAWDKLKTLVKPETYQGLYELVKPTTVGLPIIHDPIKLSNIAQSVYNDYSEKYGSWEKAKKTFQTTPIEPLMDISTVLTAGGTGLASKAGWLGKLGKTAQVSGMALDPFNVVMFAPKAIGWFASPVIKSLTEKMYLGAVKVDKGLEIEQIRRAAQRGLDENLWMSENKLYVVKDKMDKTKRLIYEGLDAAEKRGDFVDTWRAADSIDEIKKIYGERILPPEGLDEALEDLKTLLVTAHGERIPPKVAQHLKENTHKLLDSAYGKLSAYAKEAEKYATRSVREQLEEMHPALKELNPKMQEYKWLKDALEKGVKSSMEAPLMEGISFYNAVVRRTIDQPKIKSMVAIALHKASKMNKVSPVTTIAREQVPYKIENIFPYQGKNKEAQLP